MVVTVLRSDVRSAHARCKPRLLFASDYRRMDVRRLYAGVYVPLCPCRCPWIDGKLTGVKLRLVDTVPTRY